MRPWALTTRRGSFFVLSELIVKENPVKSRHSRDGWRASLYWPRGHGLPAACPQGLPRGPRLSQREDSCLLPAEAADAIRHEPHPPPVLWLRCEVVDSEEQGHPHRRGREHLLPQGLGSQGPGGRGVRRGYFLPVCPPRATCALPPQTHMELMAGARTAPWPLQPC